MKVLVAEDDPVTARLLERLLTREGYEVEAYVDGEGAANALFREGSPEIALLDWILPGLSGVELCRRLRAHPMGRFKYAILLTAKGEEKDVVAGLDSGADDYIAKPFSQTKLLARLRVGRRVLDLQRELATRVQDLEAALREVHQLRGFIPICSYCKKVRNDQDFWQRIEEYISERSGSQFSHGICPDCEKRLEKGLPER